MSDAQQYAGPAEDRPFGVPQQRTPVEFDPVTGGLRIGQHERRVEDPSEPNQIYGAYLSLLYAVRGAQPGEQLPLRTADLEALLLIVGDDPANIEQRLIGLMGCTAEEAKALGGILLRHRRLTATLGVAAMISAGAVSIVNAGGSDEGPVRAELVQSTEAVQGSTPNGNHFATDEEWGVTPVVPAAAPTTTDVASATTTSVLLAGLVAPPSSTDGVRAENAPANGSVAPSGGGDTAPGAPADLPLPTDADVVPVAPGNPPEEAVDGPPAAHDDAPTDIGVPAYEDAPAFAPPTDLGTVIDTAPPQAPANDMPFQVPAPVVDLVEDLVPDPTSGPGEDPLSGEGLSAGDVSSSGESPGGVIEGLDGHLPVPSGPTDPGPSSGVPNGSGDDAGNENENENENDGSGTPTDPPLDAGLTPISGGDDSSGDDGDKTNNGNAFDNNENASDKSKPGKKK